jgi:hypothetical protein
MKIDQVTKPGAEIVAQMPSVLFAKNPELASQNAKAKAAPARAHQLHISLIDMGRENVGTEDTPDIQHIDTAIKITESDGTEHLIVCGVAGGPTQVVCWIDPADPITIQAIDVPDPEGKPIPAVIAKGKKSGSAPVE